MAASQGLEAVVNASTKVLPYAVREAFVSSQNVSYSLKLKVLAFIADCCCCCFFPVDTQSIAELFQDQSSATEKVSARVCTQFDASCHHLVLRCCCLLIGA